ncbi:MAG: Nif3-like dinuclear metal center hexameric protein [Deltaproteobacteria bacterium]|nr:Nif3-like dinuclear metal center hexameric protein [Deltaproteobacteria bacterium]
MQLDEVLTILNTIAPFETCEQWDNVGLMVGDPAAEITSIAVALDPSFDVITRAIHQKADCIITHHPLFFAPIRCMNLKESTAKKAFMLLRSGISLVSMHTNLDMAHGGVADVLANKLGLEGIQKNGVIRTGTVAGNMPLTSWCRSLPFAYIRMVDAGLPVRLVSACPGSGMDYWRDAKASGCDTFVTGDVRYHAALDAKESGMNVVDLGHHGTEEIIVKPFMEKLQQELQGVYISAYESADVFMSGKGE